MVFLALSLPVIELGLICDDDVPLCIWIDGFKSMSNVNIDFDMIFHPTVSCGSLC